MTILSTIRDLIKGSPDAETATRHLMEVLAREAIKTGDPDALVSVAAQWQELLDGRPAQLALPEASGRQVGIRTTTPPEALREPVLEVMRSAWLSGVTEVTTGVIQKGVDRQIRAGAGWSDADLEDVSDRPGVQHRWRITLSTCLRDMRQAGEIRNDAKAWKTYTLAPHMRPTLPPTPARHELEPTWVDVLDEALEGQR
jgi:hypothetical protein